MPLNPEDPRMRSLVDNPDIYFQLREANNTDYANLPDVVEDYMAQISRLTGPGIPPVQLLRRA